MELDDIQRSALTMLLSHDVHCGVVTGGPGTGKTTILRAFLENHYHKEEQVVLLAPTGRAARRISEVTRYTAYTVHRWILKDDVSEGGKNTVVIVDEASMLDVETLSMLFHHLDSIRRGYPAPPGEDYAARVRVFFLGDVDQLPSVGAGNVLTDLIDSAAIPVVRLGRVYRSKDDSWVSEAAPAIMRGEFPFRKGDAGFQMIEAPDDQIASVVVETALRESRSSMHSELLVLVPQNTGECGAAVINAALQARRNPEDDDSFSVSAATDLRHHIKKGDRVIATINDYERMVFNGETGTVISVQGRGEGSVVVEYDYGGEQQTYTKSAAAETLRLAYALTVHKAQGSEAKTVILVASLRHSHMLTRRLFYTAVTRAQQRVVIVGQRAAVEHAVENVAETHRLTTLCDRIRNADDRSGASAHDGSGGT